MPRARHTTESTQLHARLYQGFVKNVLGEYPHGDFVPLSEGARPASLDVKLVAYYLPQFHPIPENDEWWGKGFTEWRNVARAFPLFEGHYQPRAPGELGYYDLRVPGVLRRQAELAKTYGISAFCFHFYWFAGRRLLELPVERYLEDKTLDLGFSLCWANENWSRRWDGSENEVLIAQDHSPEDDVAFIRYANRYFSDDRYLKVDGKPVLTVYRPTLLPDPAATVRRWREEIKRLGHPGIYLIATNAFGFTDYDRIGFDALSEFPPHHVAAPNIQNQFEMAERRNGWRVRSYADIVNSERARQPQVNRVVHPGVMPGWDNSPRKPTSGEIIHGHSPELFEEWLEHAVGLASRNPSQERLVFINAWNEWAEGAYLEPDRRYGYAYLDRCRAVLDRHSTNRWGRESKLVGHCPWKMGSKTVLLCSHHAGKQVFGGERSFVDIAWALQGRGWNVVITLQEAKNTNYVESLLEVCQEICVFPYGQWTHDPASPLSGVGNFLKAISDVRPDLIYVNTIVVPAPLAAGRLAGVPTIVHAREIIQHDSQLLSQIGIQAGAIVEQVIRSADRIVANSAATARAFAGGRHLSIIPNVADQELLDLPNTLSAGKIRFGLVSSNFEKKGIDDFIELARSCESLVRGAEFLIIGPERRLRETRAAALKGLPPNLKLVDYHSSPVAWIDQVNVVVNFSLFQESFGRTVLEGMMARRPAIVYDWGALPELVDDQVTGFVVPFRDVRAAAECVKKLCDAHDLLLKMGGAARETALSRFSLERFAAEIDTACRDTLAAKRSTLTSYSDAREARLALQGDRRVDIIICVHNALDHVKDCLNSVLRHARPHHSIILIDDGSDDPTKKYLEELARQHRQIRLHCNPAAVGYTRSANIGLELSRAELAILLNSDTVVTSRWAEKMADAVFSAPGAGIVGVMSNAAGYQSLPSVYGEKGQPPVNAMPSGISPEAMNAWCERSTTESDVPYVPIVHGFCFGITRDTLNRLGRFDEELFAQGYGEENDYCLRALAHGVWSVVATHTFVFHAKTKSYTSERARLLTNESQEALYRRYGREQFLEYAALLDQQPVLRALRRESAELFRQGAEDARVHVLCTPAGNIVG